MPLTRNTYVYYFSLKSNKSNRVVPMHRHIENMDLFQNPDVTPKHKEYVVHKRFISKLIWLVLHRLRLRSWSALRAYGHLFSLHSWRPVGINRNLNSIAGMFVYHKNMHDSSLYQFLDICIIGKLNIWRNRDKIISRFSSDRYNWMSGLK
jgi:hypothetical protein